MAPALVRINGDSPLMDPAVVDRGIGEYNGAGVDLVTNVRPRSFPKGHSVEVVSLAALQDASRQELTADDREHVTRFLYANPDRYRIRNFACERPLGHLQLSVDTPEDFSAFQCLIGSMSRSHVEYGLLEIVEMHAALQLPQS